QVSEQQVAAADARLVCIRYEASIAASLNANGCYGNKTLVPAVLLNMGVNMGNKNETQAPADGETCRTTDRSEERWQREAGGLAAELSHFQFSDRRLNHNSLRPFIILALVHLSLCLGQ
ncbi:hypothetical protein JOQ06_006113, partial [Pogonophryne albipinna]